MKAKTSEEIIVELHEIAGDILVVDDHWTLKHPIEVNRDRLLDYVANGYTCAVLKHDIKTKGTKSFMFVPHEGLSECGHDAWMAEKGDILESIPYKERPENREEGIDYEFLPYKVTKVALYDYYDVYRSNGTMVREFNPMKSTTHIEVVPA